MLENVFPWTGFEPATFKLVKFSEGVKWLQKR